MCDFVGVVIGKVIFLGNFKMLLYCFVWHEKANENLNISHPLYILLCLLIVKLVYYLKLFN